MRSRLSTKIILAIVCLLIAQGCAEKQAAELRGARYEEVYSRAMAKAGGKPSAAVEGYESTQAKKDYVELDFEKKRQVAEGLDQELDKRLGAELATCKSILSNYEVKANNYRWGSFWIAVVGALAGGVGVPALAAAAPIANRSAISALGGVSGAANTAQGALERVGLTADQFLETRKGLAAKLEAAFTEYKRASDLPITTPDELQVRYNRMAAAIAQIKIACMTYDIAKTTSAPPGGGVVSDFTVTVGMGTTPTYTWGDGNASMIIITNMSSGLPIWQVVSNSAQGVGSPVKHGTVPTGASQQLPNPENSLTTGVQYKVTVLRKDNKTGFATFTP